MCVLGYIPDTVSQVSNGSNTTTVIMVTKDARYYATKSLSYAGPILMGCGFFAIIVSCVLYCEIVDRYAVLLPNKPQTRLRRRDVLEMILSEFKKSYFRGIEVPIRKEPPATQKLSERPMETLLKALSISTPVLLMSPDLAPGTWRFSHPHPYNFRGGQGRHLALKPRHPKLKQLGGGRGSGGSGGGVGGGGRGGLGVEHEAWLKTSSLPNICDPESLSEHGDPVGVQALTQVAVLDHLQESVRARRLRRFARPSCSMDGKISLSLPQTLSQSSTGVDNPAYLHEKIRRRSLSMCVQMACLNKPSVPRVVKTSQLQPRERLQQLQQQHIHQQRQILLQQKEEQQQQQQQQNNVKKKPLQRQDSERSRGRRRDSDGSRFSKQRPKLAQTRGSNKTFDSSSGVISPTSCPSEPPPFPLPAHFMQPKKQRPDSLPSAVSPRTAKLLRAKCQSLEVREKEKKKTEVMLLKDLFRVPDVQESPTPPSPLTSQASTGSLQGTDLRDALTGQCCESPVVTVHSHNTASNKLGKKDGAFVRLSGSHTDCKTHSDVDYADTHDVIKSKLDYNSIREQRYKLPLLSGVARTNRQWEAERRRRIFRESTADQKSYSLDASSPGPPIKAEASKSRMHRSTSFKSPLARESKLSRCRRDILEKHLQTGVHSDRSFPVQLLIPQLSRTGPRSSGEGNCSRVITTPTELPPVIFSPSQRDCYSVIPMTSQSSYDVMWGSKHKTSDRSEPECQRYSSPCEVVYESEDPASRTVKPAVNNPRTLDAQCLKTHTGNHSHNDHRAADISTSSQQRQQHNQKLVVPALVHPRVQSPKYLDPVKVEQTLNQSLTSNKNRAGKDSPSFELSVENRAVVVVESPESKRDPDPGRHDPVNDLNTKSQRLGAPGQEECRGSHQRDVAKRRSTIVHRASVHLSLDSYADSSMSITSSTVSSTDNTTSSNVALIMPPSPTTTSHSVCSGGGGVSSGGGGGGGGNSGGGGSGGGREGSTQAMRRMRYTQSRSVAVEEMSADEEETEDTPLIQAPHSSSASGTVGKS
ncbi:hypothetical protein ACOMHN_055986 [Nucella lapillus]